MTKTKSKTKKTATKAVKPTLVAFLLDRSGSMSGHLDETISAFNDYIKAMKQNDKEAGGKGRFTLTMFDSSGITMPQKFLPAGKAVNLTRETYVPGAYTPLYDAVGRTIRETEKDADKYQVLFVVQTDGMENASLEFDLARINAFIKDKETRDHWTFAYVGMGPAGWGGLHTMSAGTVSATNVMHYTGQTSNKAFAKFADSDKKMRVGGIRGQTVNCSVANFYEGDEDQTQ